MKTLIILLLSFTSFGQQDTIGLQDTIPSGMTRQQSRLYFGVLEDRVKLEETKAKLADDQHKRETSKEIKSLRFGFRSLKVENATIRKQFKLTKDSLKRSFNLELNQEKNRNSEVEKGLRNDKRSVRLEFKKYKKDAAIEIKKLNNEKRRYLLLFLFGVGIMLIITLIIYVRYKKLKLTRGL